MLKAKNIIYGFCKYTNPPKNKYLISLYRSEDLNKVYIDLIYAFYTSPLTPQKYKPIFDRILQEYFTGNSKK